MSDKQPLSSLPPDAIEDITAEAKRTWPEWEPSDALASCWRDDEGKISVAISQVPYASLAAEERATHCIYMRLRY
jgi:hypothetical protein